MKDIKLETESILNLANEVRELFSNQKVFDEKPLEYLSLFFAKLDEFEAFHEQAGDVGLIDDSMEEKYTEFFEEFESFEEELREKVKLLKIKPKNKKAWDKCLRRLHLSLDDENADSEIPTILSELASHHRSYRDFFNNLTEVSSRKIVERKLRTEEDSEKRRVTCHKFHESIKNENVSKTLLAILKSRKKLANAFGEKTFFNYKVKSLSLSDSSEIEKIVNNSLETVTPLYKELFDGVNNSYEYYKTIEDQKRQELKKTNKVLLKDYIQASFSLIEEVLSVKLIENNSLISWHSECKVYEVYNDNNELMAYWHIDYLARDDKYAGAWAQMAKSRYQVSIENSSSLPLVFLGFNIEGDSFNTATIQFEDTRSILHEIGHALEHSLSDEKEYFLSGVNALNQDLMEVSSLFLEKFMAYPGLISLFTDDASSLLKAYKKEKIFDLAYISLLSKIDIEIHKNDFQTVEELKIFIENLLKDIGILHPLVSADYINVFDHAFWDNEYASTYYCYLLGFLYGENMYSKAIEKKDLKKDEWFQRFWRETSKYSKLEAVEGFLESKPLFSKLI